MCGRFTLTLDPGELQEKLELGPFVEMYQPHYNIAPTQSVSVVRDPQSRSIEQFKWGLIPFWAKDKEIGNRMINARAETLTEKPSFRSLITKKRCLILADGFFEWSTLGNSQPKSPYYFQLENGEPFTFAGLYDEWRPDPENKILSCTIITCTPNELISKYHDRMPVIMPIQHRWDWLNPAISLPTLLSMLSPFPASRMSARPVSKLINLPLNDFPEVLDPITP